MAVSKEVEKALIEREIASAEQTMCLLTIRSKVAKRQDNKESMKVITADMEKVELALDELNKMLADLKTNK